MLKYVPYDQFWIWMHETTCIEMRFMIPKYLSQCFHTLFNILPSADSHQRTRSQQRLSRLLQLTAQIPLAQTCSFPPEACEVQWRIIYHSASSHSLICAQLSDDPAVPSETSGYSILPETKYANHIKCAAIELALFTHNTKHLFLLSMWQAGKRSTVGWNLETRFHSCFLLSRSARLYLQCSTFARQGCF